MNDIERHSPARPSLKDRPRYRQAEVSVVANEILSDGRLDEVQLDVALEQVSQYSQASKKTEATETNGGIATTPTASQPPLRSFWIDVEIPNNADLRQALVKHDKDAILDVLPSFLRRHLLYPAQLQIPQTLIFAQSALIILRILPDNFEEGFGMRHAAAICLEGLLITITTSKPGKKPNPPPRSTPNNSPKSQVSSARRDLLDRLDTTRRVMEQELPEASTTAALSIWLQVHLQRVSIVLHRVRAQVLDLCERMDAAPHSVDLSDIVSLKDTLLRILSVAEEQQEVLESLSKSKNLTSTVDYTTTLKPHLKALLATSGATERTAHRLDKRIAYVRTSYEALQQDRINHRLNVLTVFSAVFLPLTLMAGVWGMNFTNMPELERENAYYFALGSMALVGLTMLCTFWRLGWFA